MFSRLKWLQCAPWFLVLGGPMSTKFKLSQIRWSSTRGPVWLIRPESVRSNVGVLCQAFTTLSNVMVIGRAAREGMYFRGGVSALCYLLHLLLTRLSVLET